MTAGPGRPGAAPPAAGLTVRAEGSGFHARLWPRPPLPLWRLGGAVVGFTAAGAALASVVGTDPGQQVAITFAVPAFGALLVLVGWLPGLAPLEVDVDDDRVYWNGERYPWARVGGARAHGTTLELVGPDGARLDRLEHLAPEAARWLADAIGASIPAPPPLPSGTT